MTVAERRLGMAGHRRAVPLLARLELGAGTGALPLYDEAQDIWVALPVEEDSLVRFATGEGQESLRVLLLLHQRGTYAMPVADRARRRAGGEVSGEGGTGIRVFGGEAPESHSEPSQ